MSSLAAFKENLTKPSNQRYNLILSSNRFLVRVNYPSTHHAILYCACPWRVRLCHCGQLCSILLHTRRIFLRRFQSQRSARPRWFHLDLRWRLSVAGERSVWWSELLRPAGCGNFLHMLERWAAGAIPRCRRHVQGSVATVHRIYLRAKRINQLHDLKLLSYLLLLPS